MGSPTSYASGYISAQRTSRASQSLTVALSSPPTYWIGLLHPGQQRLQRGKTRLDGHGKRAYASRRLPTLSRSPTAIQLANMAEPPYETNGSGSPVTGMIPSVIPMLTKVWNANQQTTPARDEPAERSGDRAADAQPAPQQQPEQHDERAGADEAELLAGHGEDEVGLLLGHERAVGLRARGTAPCPVRPP